MNARFYPAVLTLLLGLGIGWLIPKADHEFSSEDSAAPAEPVRTNRHGSRASFVENRDWAFGEAKGSTSGSRRVEVSVGFLGGISKVPPVRSCRDDLFRADDETIGWLKINEREQQGLEKAWAAHRVEVEMLEVSRSSSKELDDGSVDILVPDLSDELRLVGNRFADEVRNLIGPERGDVLLQMKQIDRAFASDAGDRHYQVRVEPTGDGKWRFHMIYRDNENHRVWVGDSVPNEIRHITDAARIANHVSELGDPQ